MAVPTCALWYTVAYPPTDIGVEWALMGYTVGANGFMKTIDVCVVGFRDSEDDIPRWVALKKGEKGKDGRVSKVRLPLPTTLRGRIIYALDYLLASRGGSFFLNRAFSWAMEPICSYDPPPGYRPFLKSRIRSILIQTLATDILFNVIATQPWNFTSPYPLTNGLPIGWQIFYTLAIGLQIYFSLFLMTDVLTVVVVPLFRLHPETWMPFWWEPYKSSSLEEFWSTRWHATFQRVFYRMSIPAVEALRPYVKKPVLRFSRAFFIFIFSAIYHMAIPLVRSPWDHENRYLVFWEWSVIMCFLSQPFGLLLESMVVRPATEGLSGSWKTGMRRAYFWVWLVWTGRWFCDSYLLYGPFGDIPFGPFSPTLVLLRLFNRK